MQYMRGLPEDAVREIEQIHSKWIELEIPVGANQLDSAVRSSNLLNLVQ
jgi:hypothetical protein